MMGGGVEMGLEKYVFGFIDSETCEWAEAFNRPEGMAGFVPQRLWGSALFLWVRW